MRSSPSRARALPDSQQHMRHYATRTGDTGKLRVRQPRCKRLAGSGAPSRAPRILHASMPRANHAPTPLHWHSPLPPRGRAGRTESEQARANLGRLAIRSLRVGPLAPCAGSGLGRRTGSVEWCYPYHTTGGVVNSNCNASRATGWVYTSVAFAVTDCKWMVYACA